ncbi:hypothetical protein BABINDRAFT_163920 [Babjeviella inositovora NRRL Y-12698]|uniref:Uncharacterized protein n=1 Tax=Babjeviella inositovora NRRL Y-12698 TaxID=984486 RepID=A0A1E3QH51_9ASCO|nr:uncharacterized protein BABINDRAFT_163920 [Babjeviella inositovora NRRL Y-12698]ODQ77026.1 hypothetical protein BABINDRAFT_163920 [Babjeviella inositovora NRRL Y-12698]
MPPELPGFVFDPVKKRYFRIIAGASSAASSTTQKYTNNAVQAQKRDISHQKKLRKKQKVETKPNVVQPLHQPLRYLISPSFRLCGTKPSHLCKVLDAYNTSQWELRCSFDPTTHLFPRVARGTPQSIILAENHIYYNEAEGRVFRFPMDSLRNLFEGSLSSFKIREVANMRGTSLTGVVVDGSSLVCCYLRASLERVQVLLEVQPVEPQPPTQIQPTQIVPLSRFIFCTSFRYATLVVGQEGRLTVFPLLENGLFQEIYHLKEDVMALDQNSELLVAGCRLGMCWIIAMDESPNRYDFRDPNKRKSARRIVHKGGVSHVKIVEQTLLVVGLKGVTLYDLGTGDILVAYEYLANPGLVKQVFDVSMETRQFVVNDAKGVLRVYGLGEWKPIGMVDGLEGVQCVKLVDGGLVVFDRGELKLFANA